MYAGAEREGEAVLLRSLRNADYFECACKNDEHTLRFWLDDWDADWPPELYAHVFLIGDRFFKRLWQAVLFTFGHKSKYGHFDEWILDEDDADRLIDMINEFKKTRSKWKNSQKRG